MKCPICRLYPPDPTRHGHDRKWCFDCNESAAQLDRKFPDGNQIAKWAARRARAALLSTARRQSHAMNINVVGALTDLREAVLKRASESGSTLEVDMLRLARRAKGKPIEPVADVQKRARAAAKRRGK